jgi:hypothetical protein
MKNRRMARDYEPQGSGLCDRAPRVGSRHSRRCALDYVFGDQANDLVMPEAGVYGAVSLIAGT